MGLQVSVPATDDVATADVRAFVRVVDLGSMTAAARSLGETKGSVSRRVARLERAVGLPLIRRDGRGVAATEDGFLYRQKAGQALEQLDDALATVRALRGTPAGHLRITAPIGFGTLVVGAMIGQFTEQYPSVTLEAIMTDAVLSFGHDRIDVAFRLSPGLPDSSLVAHKLFDVEGRLVASPAYVARHGAPMHPDELERHRVLVPPIRGTTMPLRLAPVDGSEPPIDCLVRGHVLSHDVLLLREAALAGAGVTMVGAELARGDLERGDLVEVLTGWRVVSAVGLYLVTAGGTLPPKTRVFRDFARDYWRRAAAGGGPRCPGPDRGADR